MFGDKCNIVVLDENADSAFELHLRLNQLERLEHQFHHFADLNQGLAYVESSGDVAFLPLEMEGQTAEGLLKGLRDRQFDKPLIVMLDDDLSDERILDLQQAGADDCLRRQYASASVLVRCLSNAHQRYLRRRAEREQRELLRRTLAGSVRLLLDLLAMLQPAAYEAGVRLRPLVRSLAARVRIGELWEVEVATMLSHLGCLKMPQDVVLAASRNRPLGTAEAKAFAAHPRLGGELIRRIPRMEGVAAIVERQADRFDGIGSPDGQFGTAIPLGARLLKVAIDFQRLLRSGLVAEAAVCHMRTRTGCYDPQIMQALEDESAAGRQPQVRQVRLADLTPAMVLDEPLVSESGTVLVRRGRTVGETQRRELEQLHASGAERIREPVQVRLSTAHESGTR